MRLGASPGGGFSNAAAEHAKRDGARDSMRRILRDATRNDHQFIDQAVSTLDLTDRVGYGIFLAIHHTALGQLAGRWRPQDHADFAGLLRCLSDDLRAMGHPDGVSEMTRGTKTHSLRQWGIAYVIRGSRLGGAVLRQRVPSGFPASYLTYSPTITWPQFLKQLEHETPAINLRAQAQIIRGAKQAFEAFKAAAAGFGLCHE
jgi:heme oxygenase